MIRSIVNHDGEPVIGVDLAGRMRDAIIDTGYNCGLLLPESLFNSVDPQFVFWDNPMLASGEVVGLALYEVRLRFDGTDVVAEAAFADVDCILVGTDFLANHRLEIDFPKRTIVLERSPPPS